jgi:predicted transglutaminase-like cysteine proteinase
MAKIRIRTAAAPLMVAALLAVPVLGTASANTTTSAFPGIFGTRTSQSPNIALFPKWSGALSRYFGEQKLVDAPCTSSMFNACHLKDWKSFLQSIRGKDKLSQVRAVNTYMNRRRYLTDPRNYGVKDYWATPGQFFKRNGDCEDYAIAKFMSLRALGFTNKDMRIVVLQDLNLRIGHAILVVHLNGQALVLDNQVRSVVRAESIRHYRPIYSINERSWWLHRRS